MDETTERKTNRLVMEKSPYLRAHAHNPVDWHPWSNEAFLRAASENKPVFLSIGYSSCHWCHVMEKESFEDPEVARLLNETFVCVKVDREERPDIDHIYMAFCQHLTGRGGWPLTIVTTPERMPFFAGTYIPRESAEERIGMIDLVAKVRDLWTRRKAKAVGAAEEMVDSLRKALAVAPGPTPKRNMVEKAFSELLHRHDSRYGGFGQAPKFPMPVHILFILRYWQRTRRPEALEIAERTLTAMRDGGIYDQVGFGFHRYAVDSRWIVPHFEKMLPDQALLAMAYTEAFQATGRAEFARTAKEILAFVTRDLGSPSGAFYCSQDADTEGQEGVFYTWTAAEVDATLDSLEAPIVRMAFSIRDEGNLPTGTGEHSLRNILHRSEDMSGIAARFGVPRDDLDRLIDRALAKLLATRNQRPLPLRDGKILTDWNGLTIAALAKAAAAFEDVRLAEVAAKAADFVLKNLRGREGGLLHRFCDGEAAVEATLDDHAFLAWGLLELHQSTYRHRYFEEAARLMDVLLDNFWDPQNGGFFFTQRGRGPIPVRFRPSSDGATPSGNAVAAMVLLRMARLTADPAYEEKVARIGRAFSNALDAAPSDHPMLASVFNMALGSSSEVVVVGDPAAEDTVRMLGALRRTYAPNAVSLFIAPGARGEDRGPLMPYVRDLANYDGRATAYVCKDYICRAPTTDPEEMAHTLEEIETRG